MATDGGTAAARCSAFSRVAVPSVVLLVLTGLVLAIVQLGNFGALVDTRYGIILSIKLALVALLLGLAVLNRFCLTPALALDPQNTRPLLRSILAECVLVVGILAVVAGWRFTPPPRALAAAVAAPLAIHIHTDNADVSGAGFAGQGRRRRLCAAIDERRRRSAAGQGGHPDAEPAGARHRADRAQARCSGADGHWSVRDVPLPVAGRWHLQIDALVTDFEKITLRGEFDVPTR